MKQLLSFTLALILFFCTTRTEAQLYSNGVNNITGNFVGIGTGIPDGSLHIKENMYQDYVLGGGGTGQWIGSPMLRLQSSHPTVSPVQQHFWDLLTDGTSTLKWRYALDGGSSTTRLSLSPTLLQVNTAKMQHNQTYQTGLAKTPDGTTGAYMSIGMMHQSGDLWSGKGAALFTSNSGSLFFVANDDNMVSTYADLKSKSTMELKGTGELKVKSKLQVGSKGIPVGAIASFSGGDVYSEKYICKSSGNWPDYVFEDNYDLRTLDQLKQYIEQNNHLPEIPSASEIDEQGVDLEQMNKLLLKKVEELTLYLINMREEIDKLKSTEQ